MYRFLVGKLKRKSPLRRHRLRREDMINIDLRGVEWGDMDWIDLVQDKYRWRAVVNAVMNLRVPENVGKFLTEIQLVFQEGFSSMEEVSK